MKKQQFKAVLLTLGLFGATAQAQQATQDPQHNLNILTQKPVTISTSLKDAINAILNENTPIEGLIGPIPKEIHDALERAAIRTPVKLITGSASSRVPFSNRIKIKRTDAEGNSTMIAVGQKVVYFENGKTTLLQAPMQAISIRSNIDQIYDKLP